MIGNQRYTDFDHFKGMQDTGVIAQQVDALGLPGITTTRSDGTMAVRYERLVPLLNRSNQRTRSTS